MSLPQATLAGLASLLSLGQSNAHSSGRKAQSDQSTAPKFRDSMDSAQADRNNNRTSARQEGAAKSGDRSLSADKTGTENPAPQNLNRKSDRSAEPSVKAEASGIENTPAMVNDSDVSRSEELANDHSPSSESDEFLTAAVTSSEELVGETEHGVLFLAAILPTQSDTVAVAISGDVEPAELLNLTQRTGGLNLSGEGVTPNTILTKTPNTVAMVTAPANHPEPVLAMFSKLTGSVTGYQLGTLQEGESAEAISPKFGASDSATLAVSKANLLAAGVVSAEPTVKVELLQASAAVLQQSQGIRPADMLALEVVAAKTGAVSAPLGEAPTTVAAAALASTNGVASAYKGLQVTVPVSQPNFMQASGEKILWMVSQKLQTADIQLDPPELGPLQVRVSVHQDQVSVSFVSHHPQVREALDLQALRLREMFESQGLNLVDVDVSDQSFQQQEQQSSGGGTFANVDHQEDEDVSTLATSIPAVSLVDHYV